jgi:hypothetical protein
MDRGFDLGTLEADVAQDVVVELAKPCDGGAMVAIARDRIPTSAEKSGECSELLRDLRPDDRCKGRRHFQSPWLSPGNATPSAPALIARAVCSSTAEAFADPGTIRLMQTK